jgi:hypothetical protein
MSRRGAPYFARDRPNSHQEFIMTEIQKLKDTPEMRRDFYSMHSYRIPNMEGGPPRRNCCGD